MSKKHWVLLLFGLLILTLGACSNNGAPIFQVEAISETTLQVGESQAINVEIVVTNLFEDLGGDDESFRYGLEASVTPADGPVSLVRLHNTTADATESGIRTSVGGEDNVFTTLEIACLEAGEAEVKMAAQTLELYDEVTIQVLCEGGDEAGGGDSDTETTVCEPFDSDINVGSIGEVGQAAVDTGLVPEDIGGRAVGQELRRMMEVTGEVCQHELLALTSGGEITPEIEGAILIAVLRVQRQSE